MSYEYPTTEIPELTPIQTARFWTKVDIQKPAPHCWNWEGSKNRRGYGKFYITGRGPSCAAHRIAWTLINGEIPRAFLVLHSCDNPSCVNPVHLFLGQPKDNVHDCISKGRHKINGSKRGPKLTIGDVRDIRKRLLNGETHSQIARYHGVAYETIRSIKGGYTWKGKT